MQLVAHGFLETRELNWGILSNTCLKIRTHNGAGLTTIIANKFEKYSIDNYLVCTYVPRKCLFCLNNPTGRHVVPLCLS